MVQRRQRERCLFEVLLPDGHKLWPDWLRKIDTLLEDDAVVAVMAQALEKRWPQSRRRGGLGTPVEVVLRMLILKHLCMANSKMLRELAIRHAQGSPITCRISVCLQALAIVADRTEISPKYSQVWSSVGDANNSPPRVTHDLSR